MTVLSLIDTVHFRANHQKGHGIFQLEESLHRVQYWETTTSSGIIGYTGNGQRIKVTSDSIWFNGSLPKYQLGENASSLTLQSVQYAIDEIAGMIDLDPCNALVSRVDLATTVRVGSTPSTYFAMLGNLSRFRREIIDGSLYYNQRSKSKQLIFYDKRTEMLRKHQTVPDEYGNDELLRVEYRLAKRPHRTLKYGQISLDMLCDESLNQHFVASFIDTLKGIVVLPHRNLSAYEIKTAGQLFESICAMAIQELGEGFVNELMQQAKANAFFPPDKRSYYTLTQKKFDRIRTSTEEVGQSRDIMDVILDQLEGDYLPPPRYQDGVDLSSNRSHS